MFILLKQTLYYFVRLFLQLSALVGFAYLHFYGYTLIIYFFAIAFGLATSWVDMSVFVNDVKTMAHLKWQIAANIFLLCVVVLIVVIQICRRSHLALGGLHDMLFDIGLRGFDWVVGTAGILYFAAIIAYAKIYSRTFKQRNILE